MCDLFFTVEKSNMEKYRGFSDSGTGIAPFISRASSASIIIAFPLFLLRLPLVPLLILHFSVSSVIKLLPVSRLSYFLLRTTDKLLLGLCLILLGVRLSTSSNKRQARGKSRLVISNHSSCIDLLYHAYTYSPRFIKLCKDGTVQQVSLYSMIASLSSRSVIPDHGVPIKSLSSIVSPLLLFPEVCISHL